jgi:hypothetical protein
VATQIPQLSTNARETLARVRKDRIVYEQLDDHADAFGIVAAVQWLSPAKGAKPEPWLIRGLLSATAGRPVLSALAVEHRDAPDHEVTGLVLRGIRYADIRNEGLRWAAARAEWVDIIARGGYLSKKHVTQARWVAGQANRPVKRGRTGYGDEHYRRIARRYLEIASGPDGRRVLKVLAENEGVPRETVRDWVRKATRLGFLAPGTQGRAEARPGQKLNTKEENDG